MLDISSIFFIMKFNDIKGVVPFEKAKADEEFVSTLQEMLKEGGFYRLKVDGIWGNGTEQAVKDAANKFHLNNYDKQKFGKSFYNALKKHNTSEETRSKKKTDEVFTIKPASERQLTLSDYKDAAKQLGVEIEIVQAVAEVESARNGFFRDGRITILFEAHIFSQYTDRKYDRSHPRISSRRWNRSLYKGGTAEYSRLSEARALNEEAALLSCSYGSFQIMGFNYKLCGYKNVREFVRDQHTAKGQIKALVNFIKNRGILRYLQNKNWAAFAKAYNGSGYLVNKYDTKLANAYRKYKYA